VATWDPLATCTNWRALRVEVPWLEQKPSEIVRERTRFTTQPLEHTDGNDKLLFDMLEAVGPPEILCFASDYPHWDSDERPCTCSIGCPRPGARRSCTKMPPRTTATCSGWFWHES
jgi:hypothetical protein